MEYKRRRNFTDFLRYGEVTIDYDKLRQLCQLQESGGPSKSFDHELFMDNYRKLFKPKQTGQFRSRTLSLRDRVGRATDGHAGKKELSELEEIGVKWTLVELPPATSSDSEECILKRKLTEMARVILKYPPHRTKTEVKKLAQLLQNFPDLLGDKGAKYNAVEIGLWEGLARRATAETIISRKGCALPSEGVVHLVLQGEVEEINKDPSTGKFILRTIPAGKCFGKLKEPTYPLKYSYPIYSCKGRTLLLRVSLADYNKAIQSQEEWLLKDRLSLVSSCPLLQPLAHSIRHQLATSLSLCSYPPHTKLLSEGEGVSVVSVIQTGRCRVYKNVADVQPPARVSIGEMGEGECVGEMALDGVEVAPYTVEAETHVKLGQIPLSNIISAQVKEHLSPAKEFSVKIPSEEQVRKMYSDRLVKREWDSIKRSIIAQVFKESGRS